MTMTTFTVIHSHLTNAIPHQLDQRVLIPLLSLPHVRLHFAPAFLNSIQLRAVDGVCAEA